MGKLIEFWWSHRAELAALLGQHVLLVAASTLVAVAIAVPLGVFASRRARLAAPILGVANIVQTVPSLAMFGFLLPVPFIGGVGARAALLVLILAGAIPAALLALVVDGSLLWLERQLSSRRRTRSPRTVIGAAAVLAVVVLFSSGIAARRATGAVVVASKNFTEQLVLGELVAQTIEREGIPVARRLNLGGTLICDRALLTGDADVYVEYTGTALTAIFHQPIHADSRTVFESVRAF